MSEPKKPLPELIKELPLSAQAEVRHFVEFLLTKNKRKRNKTLRQDWAGGLSDYKEQYTSVELQNKELYFLYI